MKSTKKALVLSLLAMLLCVSMLIGTTFAWFTDTATSSNNRIVAGNLDVDLVMYNGTDYVSIAGGSGDIFDTAAIAQNKPASLWEPGKTQIVYLGVQNKGNLAIKYNIILDVTDTDTTDGVNLADVLDFAIIDGAKAGDTNYTYANWAAVTNAASTTGVIGTLMGTNPARITAAQNGTLDEIRNGTQNETNYFVLAVHMQETAGNEYQGKEIVIDLSVVATQKDAEEDSFNNQYDAGLDTPTAPTAIHDIATATFEEPAEVTTDTTGETPVSTATVAATTIQTTDATSTIAAPTTVTLSDYTAPTATDTTDKVTGLTRTIDTTASSETGVTYNIGYKATVTTTTNNVVVGTEEYAVHTFGSVVTNIVNIGTGLTGVKVTHGTVAMTPATSKDAAADGYYYYDSTTGELYIWSSTYSAYSVEWDVPDYVATIGTNGYMTLEDALAASKNNDTIVLLKDIDYTTKSFSSSTLKNLDYSLTIDLNSHSLILGSRSKINMKTGCDYTVKNGTYEPQYSTSPENNTSIKFKNVTFVRSVTSGQGYQLYGKTNVSVEFDNCNIVSTFATPSSNINNAALLAFSGGTTSNLVVNIKNSTFDWNEEVPLATFSSSTAPGTLTFDESSYTNITNSNFVVCTASTYKLKQSVDSGTYSYTVIKAEYWLDKVTSQPAGYTVDGDNYNIASSDAFAWFAKQAETVDFTGKTVHLTADIDMGAYLWKPINCNFAGTFDGGNHTISNIFSIDGYQVTSSTTLYGNGIFHRVSGTVQNLVVSKATLGDSRLSTNIVGTIAGYTEGGTFSNISVEDSIVAGYGKVGGMVGMLESGTITLNNCSVENTTIHGVYNCAGLIGLSQGNVVISGTSTNNITFTRPYQIDARYSYVNEGEYVGLYWVYESIYYYAAWGDYYTDYTNGEFSNPVGDIYYIGICHNK